MYKEELAVGEPACGSGQCAVDDDQRAPACTDVDDNKQSGKQTAAAGEQLPTAPTRKRVPRLPTDLRVILFDIDGTLIRGVRRREYRGLIRGMLTDAFGTCGRIGEIDFAGKTDLAIYREALECEGITAETIRERLPRLEAAMIEILTHLASTGEVFRLCDGVRDLLDAVSNDGRFLPSLLTGNLERLAEAKLRVARIWHYFQGRGAFGGDAEERDHLPAIAAERISGFLGQTLVPDRFVIVGDTPRDISCARHFGARVVAVASGIHTIEQLSGHSPDALLRDLSDTQKVLDILAGV